MGKIPEEVYREAKDDLETLWGKAMEYGDFPVAREIIESEKKKEKRRNSKCFA